MFGKNTLGIVGGIVLSLTLTSNLWADEKNSHGKQDKPKTAEQRMKEQRKAAWDEHAEKLNADAEKMKARREQLDAKLEKTIQSIHDKKSQLKGLPNVTEGKGWRLYVNPNIKPEVVKTDMELMDSSMEESSLMHELKSFLKDYNKLAGGDLDALADDQGFVNLFKTLNSKRAKSDNSTSLLSKILAAKSEGKLKHADKIVYFRALRLMVERYQQALDTLKTKKQKVSSKALDAVVFSPETSFKSNLGGKSLHAKQEARIESAMNFATPTVRQPKSYQLAVLKIGKGEKLKSVMTDINNWAETIYSK